MARYLETLRSRDVRLPWAFLSARFYRRGDVAERPPTEGVPETSEYVAEAAPIPNEVWARLDQQSAEAVRVAAHAGLRLGELLALRWSDIDRAGSVLTISRAISANQERPTKSGHVRQVPLADQAATALERTSHRTDFVSPEDYVFCNAVGRRLDGSALRRRYKMARDSIGMRPLRWHDLRHTFGSLLVAGGVDLVSIMDAMGHFELATTSRYLHARPAGERASILTAAFSTSSVAERASAVQR